MDTWTAIRSRRNVRDYSDEPIPDADLHRILEAARRAPSSMNQQRWDLVLVTEPGQLTELAECWMGAGHVARSQATIAVVSPVTSDLHQEATIQYDLGQMTMQLMITAADLGIGSAHAYVEDKALAQRVLALPEDRVCPWLVALGYPADGPLRPIEKLNRRAFDDVVHRGRF